MEVNKLHIGDNLQILKSLPNESIDLVYLDPPFMTNQNWKSNDNTLQFTDKWNSRQEYLDFLKIRLIELHRILKDTGSLYLHIDTRRVNHYIRLLLDDIFGEENFRNEIAWCYFGKGYNPKRLFSSKHDIIFFYTKNKEKNVFNQQMRPYKEGSLKRYKQYKDDNGRYYALIYGRVYYLDEQKKKGQPVNDWWDDIGIASGASNEYIGYPTQKPVRLIERIIKTSSNENDIVLDPFCGSGTTLFAAKKLNRQYIGIDINPNSEAIINNRLKQLD